MVQKKKKVCKKSCGKCKGKSKTPPVKLSLFGKVLRFLGFIDS